RTLPKPNGLKRTPAKDCSPNCGLQRPRIVVHGEYILRCSWPAEPRPSATGNQEERAYQSRAECSDHLLLGCVFVLVLAGLGEARNPQSIRTLDRPQQSK